MGRRREAALPTCANRCQAGDRAAQEGGNKRRGLRLQPCRVAIPGDTGFYIFRPEGLQNDSLAVARLGVQGAESLGGLWDVFCKLFCIYDLGCIFTEYYRILQGFGDFPLFGTSGVSISSIRMSGLTI